ncbi:MAG: ABC-2 transporter permease [Spirochaetaceae bacterium]|nr:ABC-2 transporter permease [Spirochaetaceae bacterium]
MKALLLRDIELRKSWLFFWGTYSLFFFMPSLVLSDWRPSMPFVLVLAPVAVGLIWVVGGAKVEVSTPDSLIASFPLPRVAFADAKFLQMVMAAAYAFLTTLVCGALLLALGLPIEFAGLDWLVALRIVAGLGLGSWFLPLFIRFGQDFARIFMIAGLSVMVVLQLGLALFLGSREGPIALAFRSAREWYAALPLVGRNLVLAGAGLAVALASWLASRRIAERKEY